MRFHNWPRVGTMGCFGPPRTKLPDAAGAHLERIVGIVGESYRGPAKCLLISDIGEVQYESDGDVHADMKTVENICILKRASLTAGQSVPAMHLRTVTGVTSLYDAGDGHIFAVCSEMHPTAAELFDGEAAEASIGEVLRELKDSLGTIA